MNELSVINNCSNDIIWFYYSGLGSNHDSWPKTYPNDISETWIHKQLKGKNARLTITQFDCSNHTTSTTMKNTVSFNSISPPKINTNILNGYNNFQLLFLKSKGNIIASSSSSGQYAYSEENSKGGVFTNYFINAIKRENNWHEVLLSSSYEVKKWSGNDKNQTPKFAWENAIIDIEITNNKYNNKSIIQRLADFLQDNPWIIVITFIGTILGVISTIKSFK